MVTNDWFTAGREKLAVALLLATVFAMAVESAVQKSVTVDEYQALPHGLGILRGGDLHLATGVPLLPSVLSALPLLATEARFDAAAMRQFSSSWQCGSQFLRENAFDRDAQSGQYVPSGRYHDYFLLGRLVSIAALVLTCGLTYGYARSLYGRLSGMLTLLVACFSPNLLAHGRLVTPDIYLAAATVASLWAFDGLMNRPTLARSAVLGFCLGLAALCKLTGLLLFLFFPSFVACQWLIARWKKPKDMASTPALLGLGVFVSLIVGTLVINAGYLFDGALTPVGQFQFESPVMRAAASALPGWLPIPLPRYFFQGIDMQLAESGYTAYLMGEFNNRGFYSYYLVALLIKTPAPVLLLCAMAWLRAPWPTRREAPLIVAAALFLLFFSLSRHKNIGLRYLLFLEPMMAIWIGRCLSPAAAAPVWLRRTIAFAAACLIGVTLTSRPHYLPYFNWLSGGPNHGHRWLLDSNLDWGQDLITLRRYMQRERIDEIDLAYFGRVPPVVYGIRYRTLRAGQSPQNRHVAISANLLWGLMYVVNGDLNDWPADPDSYSAFRRRRPKAILGHSIYVYEME
jgi:hypothetical protein